MNKVSFNDHLITLLNCKIESKLSCVKTCLMNFIFRTKMVISTGLSSYPDKSSDRSWQNVSSGSQKAPKYFKSFSADSQIRNRGACDVSYYLDIPHSFRTILMEKSSSKWTWKLNSFCECVKRGILTVHKRKVLCFNPQSCVIDRYLISTNSISVLVIFVHV